MARIPLGDDRGESLIELLVAVLIMGTAVVAVVGGLGTAIMMSDVQRKQAKLAEHLNIYAANIVGAVADSPTRYDECPDASYPTYDPGPGSGYRGYPPQVSYWNGSSFVDLCSAGNDTGVQLVTLRMRTEDYRVEQSRDVIIRKPCRPTDTPACT